MALKRGYTIMKKIYLILAVFLFSLNINAATYYVATTGSDAGTGAIGDPWLTWQYGFNRLVAGDILYIRGGVYTDMYGSYGSSWFGVRVSSSHDGTAANHITVSNYPGEQPVLDCASLVSVTGSHSGLMLDGVSYWDITGLDFTNVAEGTAHVQYETANGVNTADCDHIVFTRIRSYHNGGGFSQGGYCDYIYYIYCDAFENNDVYDNGGYANGFSANGYSGTHHFYRGCRAWENSDDGFDLYGGNQIAVIDSCWAWANGDWNGYEGNGAGIKTGKVSTYNSGVIRTVTNCLSFYNNGISGIGYDESQDDGQSVQHLMYNNISYNNQYGFNFQYSGGATDIIRNNISHDDATGYGSFGSNTVDHNSWQDGLSVSDADFLSVDTAGVSGPRAANGALPVLNFLKLASTSDFRDAGVDVGISYTGDAPDLGPYDYGETPSYPTYNGTIKSGTQLIQSGGLLLIIIE